jgi:predicted site-specific integrase-resolvase
MEQEYPDMLTAKEVGVLFGVTATAARRWAKAGYLQSIRPFGKFLFPRDQDTILAQIALANPKGDSQE